jgi:glycosyltransferase involved in cell wall biosynthesis
MLSILIPIYNFDVRQLAEDLHGQCESAGIAFEIVCFDDGSGENFKEKNRELSRFNNLIYKELPQNLGRSAIRNALGRAARFPWLLFMDCDSKVVSPDFIQKYLNSIQPGSLVYGGRCYSPTPPADPALYFHWHYGTFRESMTAQQRKSSPWHHFMTNNFLIPRDLLLAILFDETLRQYGHEDTLFGMELARRHVPIIHIDNPLEHIGLEPVDVFLKKTEQGIENLYLLWRQGKPIETRLLLFFLKCKKWRLVSPLRLAFLFCKKLMVKQLRSGSPSLSVFDFYKLGYLAHVAKTMKIAP